MKFLAAIGVCLLVDIVTVMVDPHGVNWGTVVLVLDLIVIVGLVVGRIVWDRARHV